MQQRVYVKQAALHRGRRSRCKRRRGDSANRDRRACSGGTSRSEMPAIMTIGQAETDPARANRAEPHQIRRSLGGSMPESLNVSADAAAQDGFPGDLGGIPACQY